MRLNLSVRGNGVSKVRVASARHKGGHQSSTGTIRVYDGGPGIYITTPGIRFSSPPPSPPPTTITTTTADISNHQYNYLVATACYCHHIYYERAFILSLRSITYRNEFEAQ